MKHRPLGNFWRFERTAYLISIKINPIHMENNESLPNILVKRLSIILWLQFDSGDIVSFHRRSYVCLLFQIGGPSQIWTVWRVALSVAIATKHSLHRYNCGRFLIFHNWMKLLLRNKFSVAKIMIEAEKQTEKIDFWKRKRNWMNRINKNWVSFHLRSSYTWI